MPLETPSSKQAYQEAGVSLDAADKVVSIAKQMAEATAKQSPVKLLGGIGGFSGAFELPEGYKQPVLLSACDGVGTKLKIAQAIGKHDTVGIDLVAMSVNDLLVNGGKPLIFLDYLATGKLDTKEFEQILSGIKVGCEESGCVLIGGETAEMPGCYPEGEYDLAGFAIGIVEKSKMLPSKATMKSGNRLIGLSSTGLHSNGFSLVRKIMADHQLDLSKPVKELTGFDLKTSLGQVLLTPTQLYVKPVLSILEQFEGAVLGMAHITGGGFIDNLPRVLPEHLGVEINTGRWTMPKIFDWLQQLGQLDDMTMAHTFNWGIGFVLIVSEDKTNEILQAFNTEKANGNITAFDIGQLVESKANPERVTLK